MAESISKRCALIGTMLLLPLFCVGAETHLSPPSAETDNSQLSLVQVAQLLGSDDLPSRMTAAGVAARHPEWSSELDEPLRKLAFDSKQPNALRVAAIAALAPRLFPVDPHLLELVRSNLTLPNPPMERLNAARTLASLRLSDMQMLSVAKSVGEADALVLPTLLRSFLHTSNDAAGLSLVIALGKTPAASSLSPDEAGRVLSHFSVGVRTAAKQMLEPLGVDLEKRQKHLEELAPLLEGGDPSRGRGVFFGKKAACSTCHNVSGSGPNGLMGPNLSQVGKVHNGPKLLESIIYPSAGSMPDFESFQVETTDGQNYSGVIIRQTLDVIWLRANDLAENKIETKRIKTMAESSVPIMPKGIEEKLTKDELRDLLAYLKSLK